MSIYNKSKTHITSSFLTRLEICRVRVGTCNLQPRQVDALTGRIRRRKRGINLGPQNAARAAAAAEQRRAACQHCQRRQIAVSRRAVEARQRAQTARGREHPRRRNDCTAAQSFTAPGVVHFTLPWNGPARDARAAKRKKREKMRIDRQNERRLQRFDQSGHEAHTVRLCEIKRRDEMSGASN